MKLANPSAAGPFGGVFAMQIAGDSANTTSAAEKTGGKKFVA